MLAGDPAISTRFAYRVVAGVRLGGALYKEIFRFLKKARNTKEGLFGRCQHTVVKLYSRRLQHDVAMQLISMSS